MTSAREIPVARASGRGSAPTIFTHSQTIQYSRRSRTVREFRGLKSELQEVLCIRVFDMPGRVKRPPHTSTIWLPQIWPTSLAYSERDTLFAGPRCFLRATF